VLPNKEWFDKLRDIERNIETTEQVLMGLQAMRKIALKECDHTWSDGSDARADYFWGAKSICLICDKGKRENV